MAVGENCRQGSRRLRMEIVQFIRAKERYVIPVNDPVPQFFELSRACQIVVLAPKQANHFAEKPNPTRRRFHFRRSDKTSDDLVKTGNVGLTTNEKIRKHFASIEDHQESLALVLLCLKMVGLKAALNCDAVVRGRDQNNHFVLLSPPAV